MKMWAIATNTYREAIRDKVLYLLFVFGLISIVSSRILGYMSIGDEQKIVADISLASISVFGALIAVFIGTNLVYKEVDKRTIYTIISRPIDRYEFILGKYLGLVGLIGVTTVLMGAFSAGYIVLMGGSVDLIFFEAVLLIYWKLLLITAFSVLLSSLTSPILGAIIVLCAYVFGHGTGILIDLPPHLQDTFAETLMAGAYFILPNLSNFDIWKEYANGVEISQAYVAWNLLYGTVYTAVLLYLAALVFENKDV